MSAELDTAQSQLVSESLLIIEESQCKLCVSVYLFLCFSNEASRDSYVGLFVLTQLSKKFKICSFSQPKHITALMSVFS